MNENNTKIKVVLFDIGDVLLPSRNPFLLWHHLIPHEKICEQTLLQIGFQEWGNEWDRGLVSDCIAKKKILYPREAALIQAFADQWEKTLWKSANAETIAIAQQLKAAGHKLYLASNWPADDFERACPYMPFLDLFDGMQISGHVQLVKPDMAFFRRMMDRLAFKAEEAIFIDDKKANVDAACALGMHGIVFTNANQLHSELIGLNVLTAGEGIIS
jgi:HAD superfamily hydrolase (TIGR01509 family)